MRHLKRTAKLGRQFEHRNAMLANLVCSLIKHKRVTTTLAKAKAARSVADKMVTLSKAGTIHARRLAVARLHARGPSGSLRKAEKRKWREQEDVVRILFDEIAPAFKECNGGYTRIVKLHHPDARVIAIGPAGENRVAAAIPLELHRAAGACGTGGVLGSKNLKAVVVRGTKGTNTARPKDLLAAFKRTHKKLLSGPHYPMFSRFGSAALLELFNEGGMLPTFNWLDCAVPDVEKVYSTTLKEKYTKKMIACLGCAVHCEHYYIVPEGPYSTHGAGAEYEVTCGFGPRAGGVNLEAILYINTLLNNLGIDVVQVSNWLNTMRHWWQDGLIDESDTDGLRLEWVEYEHTIECNPSP